MNGWVRRWWRKLRQPSWAQVRLLISDVDGTLLVSGETLPDTTAQLLRRLAQRGISLAFASARPYPSLARLARDADVPAWIISLDGALVHAPDGRLHAAIAFPKELLQQLLEIASYYAIHYAAFTPEALIHTAEVHIPSYLNDPLLPRLEGKRRSDFLQQPTVLLCISGSQPHVAGFLRALERLPRSLRRQLLTAAVESVTLPGTTLVELRLRTAHKGTAARALQTRLGIPAKSCLAVGDYRNDLPLFAVCGIRVAMADAVAELRSQADWITPQPASEHGIDAVLERLLSALR